MEIAPNTKISALIKENPAAIDAIATINRHFEKLRNPLLRKILASRVTISDAARIGGCQVDDFFEKLAPLGFSVNKPAVESQREEQPLPESFPLFLQNLSPEAFQYLDVREDIATGHDPFQRIMTAVNQVKEASALVIQNTFEPTPLIQILQKRGFASFSEMKTPELVYTYFWRTGEVTNATALKTPEAEAPFAQLLATFANNLREVDVRFLEMPMPMVTILNELEWLPTGQALFVKHKRVPQFLMPQLENRGFHICINEAGPEDVQLLIYKPVKQ